MSHSFWIFSHGSLEHIQDALEAIVIGRQESVHIFGYTDRLRCGEEEKEECKDGEADRDEACLTLAGHFIVAEETQAECAEEGDAHAGEGEDTEEDIRHQEADIEDRQENERQIVCDAGRVHAAAHIIHPVCHIEAEEAERDEGEQDDRIPDAGKSVAVLSQPPYEGAEEEADSAAQRIVPSSGDEFDRDHGDGGQERTDHDVLGEFSLRKLSVFRDLRLDLREDLHHEEQEEDRQRCEWIQEERDHDQQDGDKDSHPFEDLQLLEIQLTLLGVNGEAHKDQVRQHDAHRFHRFTSHVEQRTENEHCHIRSGKAADQRTENANVQKGHYGVNKIQNIHLLNKK